MSEMTLVKVTRKGQMTIPQPLREALGIEPGDYVALRPLMGGILISKASVTPEVKAEDVLRHLVASLSQEAEERGIREDEDLDDIIEDVQRRVHQERYGECGQVLSPSEGEGSRGQVPSPSEGEGSRGQIPSPSEGEG
jgi:AbrB family looped-hinge helix DNA binding protein